MENDVKRISKNEILKELLEKSAPLYEWFMQNYGVFGILIMNSDGVGVYGTKTFIPLSHFEEEYSNEIQS